MKLSDIQIVGNRIFAVFDDKRYQVLFVYRDKDACFMKVQKNRNIRFYKISELDYYKLSAAITKLPLPEDEK